MNDHSTGNLALLMQRHLLRRVPSKPFARLIETAGPAAIRLFFRLDRLAAAITAGRRDPLFLQFCGEVELCAMADLLEVPGSLGRTLRRSLARSKLRSDDRDVLPRLLLLRLEGRGMRLEPERSGAFVADLLQLSGDLPAREIAAFLDRPELVADRLSGLAAVAGRWAEGVMREGERPVAGFLALVEFLDDLLELVGSAEDALLQSALWHHHADLLDRSRERADQIGELARALAEQPEIDADAVETAAAALGLLRREAWESALVERLQALSARPDTRLAPAPTPRREKPGRNRLWSPEVVLPAVAFMALVLIGLATRLYLKAGGDLSGISVDPRIGWLGWPTSVSLVMAGLIGLSIVVLAVAIERFFAFHRAAINVRAFLTELRRVLVVEGSLREAVSVCQRYRGPLASIAKSALLKYGHPREEIEKTIATAALFEVGRLEKHLILLSGIANVAPLLGLFGTVTGMIHAFTAASRTFPNPQAVAAGISTALVTLGASLLVAIPAVLAYNYFRSRVGKTVRDVETVANALLESFSAVESSRDALSTRPRTP